MKLSSAQVLPAVALLPQAWASPSASIAAASADITYVGPIIPGGENVTLSGSAESIHDQIRNLNPAFNPDEFEIVREAQAQSVASSLSKRNLVEPTCGNPNPYNWRARTHKIQNGIKHLRSLPGDCGTDNSGVSRVSCSWGAAIYMVGKTGFEYQSPCIRLAELAATVVTACEESHDHSVNGMVCDDPGFCVIVAGSKC